MNNDEFEEPRGSGESRKPSAGEDANRILSELSTLISTGEYGPGYKLRQEALADQFQVGRWPIREALRLLTAQGLVTHEPNLGYFVARLHHDEVQQIYLMRRLLESAVLRDLRPIDSATLAKLTELNQAMDSLTGMDSVADLRRLNTDFHFTILSLSPLGYVVEELARLARKTDGYRSMHLLDDSAREKIVQEHRLMIEALEKGDHDLLIQLMEGHRLDSESRLAKRLNERPEARGERRKKDVHDDSH